MAHKRYLRSSLLVVCRRSGWHYKFPVILILLELTCEVLVSLLYLVSSKAEGAVLLFFCFLPGWLLLYFLRGDREISLIILNLFGLGILREAFAQDYHSRGLFWARAIFDCYSRITPSASIQMWAVWSFFYQDGPEFMSHIWLQLVLVASMTLSIFCVGYFTTESILVFWNRDKISWMMWLALVFFFTFDYFTRVGAICLVLRWNAWIGIGVICSVLLSEWAVFRQRRRSIFFTIPLIFSHYPARLLGRSGEYEFITRIFVSAVLALLTYIFSSLAGLLVFLIYIFVVLIELLIYVVTLNQLRRQWKFENSSRMDSCNSGELEIQQLKSKNSSNDLSADGGIKAFVKSIRSLITMSYTRSASSISNKYYYSDSKMEVRVADHSKLSIPTDSSKELDCEYKETKRPVDSREHDEPLQQDNISQWGKINQERGGTKPPQIVDYKKPLLVPNKSPDYTRKKQHNRYSSVENANTLSQRLKPNNLASKDRPQMKQLRGSAGLRDGKLDKDVISARPISVLTAPSRATSEPTGTLVESNRKSKVLIPQSSRLSILQENIVAYSPGNTSNEKNKRYSYFEDMKASISPHKGIEKPIRFTKLNLHGTTHSSSGYLPRLSTGLSIDSSYSDVLGSPSDFRLSINFENLTRRSSMASMATGFFTDALDAESIAEANVSMAISEDVFAPIVTLPMQLKAALISLEEYRRPIFRVDLKVGIVKEDLVCDFCFKDIKLGEVLFTALDVLSCLTFLKGVHLCGSCFDVKTDGRRIERCSCKRCGIVSIVDIQALQDFEKWRLSFCTWCYDNENLWFEVSREETAFWRTCEVETDAKGRVSKFEILTSKMLDDLLDFYYSTRPIVSSTNSNTRSPKDRVMKNKDMVNINEQEKSELRIPYIGPGISV